jgi:hypothetical protein
VIERQVKTAGELVQSVVVVPYISTSKTRLMQRKCMCIDDEENKAQISECT